MNGYIPLRFWFADGDKSTKVMDDADGRTGGQNDGRTKT